MPRDQWEKSTFGGLHRSPRDPQNGRSLREVQDRAGFDNEPATGCGALFLLAVTVLAILAGVLS
jgi:hypothetical protein